LTSFAVGRVPRSIVSSLGSVSPVMISQEDIRASS
jgi:hypothetical protein